MKVLVMWAVIVMAGCLMAWFLFGWINYRRELRRIKRMYGDD